MSPSVVNHSADIGLGSGRPKTPDSTGQLGSRVHLRRERESSPEITSETTNLGQEGGGEGSDTRKERRGRKARERERKRAGNNSPGRPAGCPLSSLVHHCLLAVLLLCGSDCLAASARARLAAMPCHVRGEKGQLDTRTYTL